MRSGYHDKPDEMRERADKMMGCHTPKEMKKGGKVKKKDDCYAMGGVGKIRHKESTKAGKPVMLPKMSRSGRGF